MGVETFLRHICIRYILLYSDNNDLNVNSAIFVTDGDDNLPGPGVYLRGEDPGVMGTPMQHYSEFRAQTIEKAAYYLDVALNVRNPSPESHMLYTLHVYQYTAPTGPSAGNVFRRRYLHRQLIVFFFFFSFLASKIVGLLYRTPPPAPRPIYSSRIPSNRYTKGHDDFSIIKLLFASKRSQLPKVASKNPKDLPPPL